MPHLVSLDKSGRPPTHNILGEAGPRVSDAICTSFPWPRSSDSLSPTQAEIATVNQTIPKGPLLLENLDQVPDDLAKTVDDLIFYLDRSVKLRTCDIPHHLQM